MAKVGYVFMAKHYDTLKEDKEWMQKYGCVQVVEESECHETLRPQWKQLTASLERGDEIVVSKFSNALRGSRELSSFIELCRIKVVRIISIHDCIDTKNELFPDTKVSDVMEMFGSLPEEVAALRKASAHVIHLQTNIKSSTQKTKSISRQEREETIVEMYNNGYSLDDIFKVSGFSSRSSVFRILNKYGVQLNRGKFSGPRPKKTKQEGEESQE